MSDLDETIKSLEWNERLNEVRFGRRTLESEEEKNILDIGTIEILITFFVGLLFGLIIGTIVIPTLTGVI